MNNSQTESNDEIDLLQLMSILWNGRITIFSLIALSLLIGAAIHTFSAKSFSSEIVIEARTVPSHVGGTELVIQFEELFTRKAIFDRWKEQNKTSVIEFSDFSPASFQNNVMFSMDERDLLAVLRSPSDGKALLTVKTNDHIILGEFHNYSEHVNTILTDRLKELIMFRLQYVNELNEEESKTEGAFHQRSNATQMLEKIRTGSTVMKISPPTLPEQTSLKLPLILLLAAMLGGIASVVIVMLQFTFKKHQASN